MLDKNKLNEIGVIKRRSIFGTKKYKLVRRELEKYCQ